MGTGVSALTYALRDCVRDCVINEWPDSFDSNAFNIMTHSMFHNQQRSE